MKIASLLTGFVLLTFGNAEASIDTIPEMVGAAEVGEGTLTRWGIPVYKATLYSPDGRYRADRPHALQIEYALGFSRESLAERSLEEIEKIYGKQSDFDQKVASLTGVFKDVVRGDQITGVHIPGEGALFYSDGMLLGRLDDPALAKAFFQIWLSPRTSEPELRARLIGGR